MWNKIEIVRGTSNTFHIEVLDAEGNPYTLHETEKLIFGIKCKVTDPEAIILKTASATEDGDYIVTLTPADTCDLKCDKYVYDVGLQSGGNFYNVIESSPFVICGNVTKWGCVD